MLSTGRTPEPGGTDCQLAMETSGHGALKENYFMDDGAYLMVKLLIELGRGHRLDEMIASLREPAESKEVRLPLCGQILRPTAPLCCSVWHKKWLMCPVPALHQITARASV